eukprot:CAMPEP_0183409668 /NCGR_PEP_ID=MMETSP0370-20130417/19009_1 /TAXON_ID=268820 /ORGANISM="Peridinium aciculiferum, Strain PAER-2" /LENGTH=41 /DNA_ID= /DNA_START= /DNA_END= /DNA_ORIENTATION=
MTGCSWPVFDFAGLQMFKVRQSSLGASLADSVDRGSPSGFC